MKRIILITLLIIICSLYYFPLALNALPSLNSKMVLAVMGLVFFAWDHMKHKSPVIRRDIFPVLLLGLLFSLSSYFSVVYNATSDFVFATYFVSMCVWLGGAYCVVFLLKKMYGVVTFETVFLYLAFVCAGQCVVAVLIDNISALENFVNTVFVGAGEEYFEKNPRLYGIGAGFDTAGIRFSCVLLGLAFLIKKETAAVRKNFYIFLFLIIGIIGNMVSRTTVVGLAVGCVYMLIMSGAWLRARITSRNLLFCIGLCVLLLLLYRVGVYMYDTMPGVRKAFDYGFEGFINLYETGEFSTHSSDLLLSHITDIYPDNTKTWFIGDGYFADPYNPNAFYMGTDMGYIRYIFYCGLLGLSIFLAYFICSTYVLCRHDKKMRPFFICLLIVQLIVWIKIPTDIFCFYALLLLSDYNETVVKNGISTDRLDVAMKNCKFL